MKPIALPITTVALLFSGLLAFPAASADAPSVADYRDFDAPPHHYRTRKPRDRFSRIMESLPADPRLDRSSEKAFLVSFLKILDVPPASQMLVFSTTSLQLRFISPANPRAIYFNEDVYVGYIPGGRLEVVSLDPELGPIFYIFDIPKNDATAALRFERSERCMNCHAGEDTGFVPGLVVKSVIPGPGGGSLDAFRSGQSGHGIPLSDRFGGWHVTGLEHFTNHWGNLTGRMIGGEIETIPNPPGQRFQLAKYPVGTSDILAHLLHEHQVGFVNRVVQAGYRARTALFQAKGQLTPSQAEDLDEQARIVTRYLLFADETPLPAGGIKPDPQFHADFQRQRRLTPDGRSLKDLELATRLFQHRCSYMIYSPVFEALPPVMKDRVYERLRRALHTERGDREFAYLPSLEKTAIRQILKATLKDLPAGW
ncbi:MAG TPA: hypothetical protein VJS65_16345 [Verrucomicrobiae bacterium]|nr:hypothetical protein [Verrucomicrobiae bacterium]